MIPLDIQDDVRRLEEMIGKDNMRRDYVPASICSTNEPEIVVERRIIEIDGKIRIKGPINQHYASEIPEGYNFEI